MSKKRIVTAKKKLARRELVKAVGSVFGLLALPGGIRPASMTDTFVQEWLDHVFINSNIANVGDATGLRGSTVAGVFHISLHTAWPGEAGNQATSECAYGSYARQSVARSGAGWSRSGLVMSNAALIAFPAASSGTETAFYCGIGTDLSGAGNLKYVGILGSNKGPMTAENPANDQVVVPGHGMAVDDRIAFFAIPGGTLPTGITAGTVYWVKTVPDTDNLILSTTQGGATLDITAVGAGVAFKMTGVPISTPIAPQFQIGALQITGT